MLCVTILLALVLAASLLVFKNVMKTLQMCLFFYFQPKAHAHISTRVCCVFIPAKASLRGDYGITDVRFSVLSVCHERYCLVSFADGNVL